MKIKVWEKEMGSENHNRRFKIPMVLFKNENYWVIKDKNYIRDGVWYWYYF